MKGVAQNTPTTFYYYDLQLSDFDYFVGFILQYSNLTRPPLVISISYGEPEGNLPLSYVVQFNIEAMKLIAQGVTIISASGNDGANCPLSFCDYSHVCSYTPIFPATSPYLTAVGGTQV
jgi:tripeptidyl-peptidase-1